jgi:formylmethanofuran dehydrogenase subunit E
MKTFDDAVAFHGHACPGLALGYRVALRALREFLRRSGDEEVVAVVENNSCAVDAIQLMTGCTFGKGNLIYRDYGKQVYTFIKRPSGKSIRISIDWKRPEETGRGEAMWERYLAGNRSPQVVRFVHQRKAKRIRLILDADEEELLTVTKGKEKLPHEADIYRSVTCEGCGERVAEPKARIKEGKIVCIPCHDLRR